VGGRGSAGAPHRRPIRLRRSIQKGTHVESADGREVPFCIESGDKGRLAAGEAKALGEQAPLANRNHQKFFGSPSLRVAMMFFCTSDVPPPIVSMTV
jgi:hypothetical protein